MRIFKAVLKYLVAAYIVGSFTLSLVTSVFGYDAGLMTHRAPFTVIEVTLSKVIGKEAGGHIYGWDSHGAYIGFGYDAEEYSEGTNVLSVMVWNPLNNYCDDIVERFDLLKF